MTFCCMQALSHISEDVKAESIDLVLTIHYGTYQMLFERRILMEGYCIKCKAKKEIKDPKAITMKNGKPATQGTCPTCGTKMVRIGKT